MKKSKSRLSDFGRLLQSTLAAALGVQNRKNHQRDFKAGNIKSYIAAGVIFTVLFVLLLSLVVKAVLHAMA